MASRQPVYTPIQTKIVSVLLDEKPHTSKELEDLFPDTCNDKKNALGTALMAIRRIIRPLGRDVMLMRANKASYYRLTDLSEFPPCDEQDNGE